MKSAKTNADLIRVRIRFENIRYNRTDFAIPVQYPLHILLNNSFFHIHCQNPTTALRVQNAVLCCCSVLAPPSIRMVFICCSRLWPTNYVSVNRMFHLFSFSIRLSAVGWVREEQGRRRHFNPPVLAAVSDWYRPLQKCRVQTVCDVLHSLVSTNTHGGTVKTKNNISYFMFTSAWMRILQVTAQKLLIFSWSWVQFFVRLVTLTGILHVIFIWSSQAWEN